MEYGVDIVWTGFSAEKEKGKVDRTNARTSTVSILQQLPTTPRTNTWGVSRLNGHAWTASHDWSDIVVRCDSSDSKLRLANLVKLAYVAGMLSSFFVIPWSPGQDQLFITNVKYQNDHTIPRTDGTPRTSPQKRKNKKKKENQPIRIPPDLDNWPFDFDPWTLPSKVDSVHPDWVSSWQFMFSCFQSRRGGITIMHVLITIASPPFSFSLDQTTLNCFRSH